MNRKAIEAAAEIVNGLRHVTTGDSWDDSFEDFTRSAVATFLDEAGTSTVWCERHDAPQINPKICMEWPRGFYNIRSCQFVDAVLVLGSDG